MWVFAYGSLMWRPDFPYQEACPGRLYGFHRALCVLSTRYRGTEDRPGLVLGLDAGGSCRGLVFKVAAEQAAEVRQRLHDREMITGVYRPGFFPVRLDDGRKVEAYGFPVDRRHRQYIRPASPDETVRLIRQGVGPAGSSLDYVRQTVRELERLGIRDRALRRLLDQAERAAP